MLPPIPASDVTDPSSRPCRPTDARKRRSQADSPAWSTSAATWIWCIASTMAEDEQPWAIA